jgi:hypothetical protein
VSGPQAAGGFLGSGGTVQETETTIISPTGQAQVGDFEGGGTSQQLTGVSVSGRRSQLTLTDQGAVAAALGFARDVSTGQRGLLEDFSNRVSHTSDQVAAAYASSRELAGAVKARDVIVAVLGAGVLIVALFAFRRR